MKAARKLLLAVRILHQRGHGLLRLKAGLAPSGCYWRYKIFVKDSPVKSVSGSLSNELDLGWSDRAETSPEELATIMEEKFTALLDESKGCEQAYIDWFAEVLEESKPDGLFIEYWDSYEGKCTDVRLIGCESKRVFPQPPR